MREAALVGFAEGTRQGWRGLPRDVEIWTLNDAVRRGVVEEERIDLLFEMHPLWYMEQYAQKARTGTGGSGEAEYWDWLTGERKRFPIMLLEEDRRVPSGVRYPVEEVLKLVGKRIFKSSFSYMLGLAMREGIGKVYVYGFEMGMETEYRYQRGGAQWMLGMAMGMGMVVEDGSGLLEEGPLYGYEEAQVVSRMTLEGQLRDYMSQREVWIGKVNWWAGVIEERKEHGSGDVEQAAKERTKALYTVHNIDGAIAAIKHLIENCDVTPAVREEV